MTGSRSEIVLFRMVMTEFACLFVTVPCSSRICPVPIPRRRALWNKEFGVRPADESVNVNVAFASRHLVETDSGPGRDYVETNLQTSGMNPVTDGAKSVWPPHRIACVITDVVHEGCSANIAYLSTCADSSRISSSDKSSSESSSSATESR